MKEEVEALLQGRPGDPEVPGAPMDSFVRGTARYMLQVAIEAEATAFGCGGHWKLPRICSRRVRLLLDESLPRPLAGLPTGHEVQTVASA